MSDVTTSVDFLQIRDGEKLSVDFVNSSVVAKTVKVWATCLDNLQPVSGTNKTGAEIVNENLLACKRSTDAAYTAIGFPAEFPTRFDDLDSNVFTFNLPGLSTVTIDFLMTLVDGMATSGNVQFGAVWRWIDA